MIPTREDFAHAATHPSGTGFTRTQLQILGVDQESGWLKSLIGTEIPDDVWERFVQAGNAKRAENYEKANVALVHGPLNWNRNGPKFKPEGKRFKHPSEARPSLPDSNFIPQHKRRELFDSQDWKFLRSYVLRRDRYTCQHCGARGIELHVDHKIPVTVDWSRRLDLLNLQTLCADCNSGKSNFFVG